jgi:hypothetical protein
MDNSGERRSADHAGQQPFPSVRPGHAITRIVSRTEEVAKGLGPRRVRVATVQHGHRRSLAVTNGSEEPQVAGPAAQAAGITQTGDSDCGPEGQESRCLTAQSDGPGVVVAPFLLFAIGGLGGDSVRRGAPRRRPGVSGRGRQCRCGAAPWRQARAGRSRSCRRGRCRCGRVAERRPWRPAQAFGSTWSPTPNRLGGRAESRRASDLVGSDWPAHRSRHHRAE